MSDNEATLSREGSRTLPVVDESGALLGTVLARPDPRRPYTVWLYEITGPTENGIAPAITRAFDSYHHQEHGLVVRARGNPSYLGRFLHFAPSREA